MSFFDGVKRSWRLVRMGVMTKYLVDNPVETWVVEIDDESVSYLKPITIP